jgi:hypothetical protein
MLGAVVLPLISLRHLREYRRPRAHLKHETKSPAAQGLDRCQYPHQRSDLLMERRQGYRRHLSFNGPLAVSTLADGHALVSLNVGALARVDRRRRTGL